MIKKIFFCASFILFSALNATVSQKVIICGVCKDVANRVTHSIKIMEKIGELFDDYRVIVYENNSSDTTPAILEAWEKQNLKVRAIREKVSEDELAKTCINQLEGDFFRP